MRNSIIDSYWIQLLNTYYFKNSSTDSLLSLRPYFEPLLGKGIQLPVIRIYNISTNKYEFISDNIETMTGYKPEDFATDGTDLLLSLYSKLNYKTYIDKIEPANLQLLKQIPTQEWINHVFTHHFNIITNMDNQILVKQSSIYFISTNTAETHYRFDFLTHAGNFPKTNIILHYVEKHITGSIEPKILLQNIYSDSIKLSKREIEILLLMADGHSSEQISRKLFISESTVINHRKNMLLKTRCKNVAQLIATAVRNNII